MVQRVRFGNKRNSPLFYQLVKKVVKKGVYCLIKKTTCAISSAQKTTVVENKKKLLV
jgi:hypothetical protein